MLTQDQIDAARYRWLRYSSNKLPSKAPTATLNDGRGWYVAYEYCGDRYKPLVVFEGESLDKAIDNEMSKLQLEENDEHRHTSQL